MPDFKKIPIGSRGAINVFIVDGEYIRTNLYIDFVSGGHDLVYGKDGEIVNDKGVKPFIPDNEIWLDFDLAESEVGFVLLHELYERDKMSKGMKYERAHKLASIVEIYARRHPDRLEELLKRELKKAGKIKPKEAFIEDAEEWKTGKVELLQATKPSAKDPGGGFQHYWKTPENAISKYMKEFDTYSLMATVNNVHSSLEGFVPALSVGEETNNPSTPYLRSAIKNYKAVEIAYTQEIERRLGPKPGTEGGQPLPKKSFPDWMNRVPPPSPESAKAFRDQLNKNFKPRDKKGFDAFLAFYCSRTKQPEKYEEFKQVFQRWIEAPSSTTDLLRTLLKMQKLDYSNQSLPPVVREEDALAEQHGAILSGKYVKYIPPEELEPICSAIYKYTQADLKEQYPDGYMTLYRGVGRKTGKKIRDQFSRTGGSAKTSFLPGSSWSTNRAYAASYAEGLERLNPGMSAVISARVPIERVFMTSETFGRHSLRFDTDAGNEVIVMSDPREKAQVVSAQSPEQQTEKMISLEESETIFVDEDPINANWRQTLRGITAGTYVNPPLEGLVTAEVEPFDVIELDEDLESFNLPIAMTYWNHADPAGLHKQEELEEEFGPNSKPVKVTVQGPTGSYEAVRYRNPEEGESGEPREERPQDKYLPKSEFIPKAPGDSKKDNPSIGPSAHPYLYSYKPITSDDERFHYEQFERMLPSHTAVSLRKGMKRIPSQHLNLVKSIRPPGLLYWQRAKYEGKFKDYTDPNAPSGLTADDCTVELNVELERIMKSKSTMFRSACEPVVVYHEVGHCVYKMLRGMYHRFEKEGWENPYPNVQDTVLRLFNTKERNDIGEHVSTDGITASLNPQEFFAEGYNAYISQPKQLKQWGPKTYRFMKNVIFGGLVYD